MKIDNFALIVTVKERRYTIPRIIEYYKDLDAIKVIVDSSETSYDKVKTLEDAGFIYKKFPSDMHYSEIMGKVSKELDVKFVVELPDDDFAIKSSLKECVEFLSNNSDYSVCDGLFYVTGPAGMVPKWHGSYYKYSEFVSNPNLKARLESLFLDYYYPRTQSVLRKSTWDLVHKTIFVNEETRWQLSTHERFFTLIAALDGRVKLLPVVFGLRMPSGSSKEADRVALNVKSEWDTKPKKHLDPAAFKYIIDLYVKHSSESRETSFKLLSKLIAGSFRPNSRKAVNKPYPILFEKYKDELQYLEKLMWSTKR